MSVQMQLSLRRVLTIIEYTSATMLTGQTGQKHDKITNIRQSLGCCGSGAAFPAEEVRLKLTRDGDNGAPPMCPADPDLSGTLWPFWSASKALSLPIFTVKELDIFIPLPPGSVVVALRSFSVSWDSGACAAALSPKAAFSNSGSVLTAILQAKTDLSMKKHRVFKKMSCVIDKL